MIKKVIIAAIIMLSAAALFAACEKESEKASYTEKDYRDKWVGEYSCGIDAFVYKYHINEELHKTENIYISYSLSGYAKVEKNSLDRITVYSHTNFNQCPDHISNLVMQERTRRKFKNYFVPVSCCINIIQSFYW